MDVEYRSRISSTFLRHRLFEWGVLSVVVLIVFGVGMYYAHIIQTQAEFAAVQSTLGRLRTALVVDHVYKAVHENSRPRLGQMPRPNPFLLLENNVSNYAGVIDKADAVEVEQGSWVYSTQCGCIGYFPMNIEWDSDDIRFMPAWFQVNLQSGTPQLQALQRYVWQNHVLQ